MNNPMIRMALVSVLLFSPPAIAQSLLDAAARRFEMAKCLMSNTLTMCLHESLVSDQPSVAVEERTRIYGRSEKYYLVTTSPGWIRLWPDQERKEDLVLAEKSGKAWLEVSWEADKVGEFEAEARKPLESVLEKLNAEPTLMEANFWPFLENGVIYRICYNTTSQTSECEFSAAVNLPGGFVRLRSHSTMDESILASVAEIIASIDVPEGD